MTKAPDSLQDLRRRIYRKAKSDYGDCVSPLPPSGTWMRFFNEWSKARTDGIEDWACPALRRQLLYGGGVLFFGCSDTFVHHLAHCGAMFSENSSRCDSKEISISCLFVSLLLLSKDGQSCGG
jgi:hypothetical protein